VCVCACVCRLKRVSKARQISNYGICKNAALLGVVCVYIRVCVCVCVCLRERERDVSHTRAMSHTLVHASGTVFVFCWWAGKSFTFFSKKSKCFFEKKVRGVSHTRESIFFGRGKRVGRGKSVGRGKGVGRGTSVGGTKV